MGAMYNINSLKTLIYEIVGDTTRFQKMQSWVGELAGERISFDIPAYVNNPTGSASTQNLADNFIYSPDTLTVKAYEITVNSNGITTRTPYNGRVYYKPNIINNRPGTLTDEWGVVDLTNGSFTLAAGTNQKLLVEYSPYTFRLVESGAANNQANIKDQESINIVSDGRSGNTGNDGKPSINLLLDNENITLNATEDGKTRITNLTIGYQGYVGASESNDFIFSSYTSNTLVQSAADSQNHDSVTITIKDNIAVTEGATGTITLNFKYKANTSEELTISKNIFWNAKLDAKKGEDAIILTFEYGGSKTTYFKNESGQTTVTPKLIQNGVNILDNTYTVAWADLINTDPVTGNPASVPLDSNRITAIISPRNISGVGSYSCTVSKNGVSYTQYISFTDYSDPLQVELISTIGDKLTNGIGEGVIYTQTTRNGNPLDQVSSNSLVVYGYTSAPENSSNGDFYFNTNSNDLSLYKKVSGSWIQNYDYDQIFVLSTQSNTNPIIVRILNTTTHKYSSTAELSTLSYVWSFRDIEGNTINPTRLTDLKVSYRIVEQEIVPPNITNTQIVGGQFIYINKNVVNKKIIILCQVTKND